MGFYPYMQGKVERMEIAPGRKRIVRASVFCVITQDWLVKDFDGYDPTAAVRWVAQKMNELEM